MLAVGTVRCRLSAKGGSDISRRAGFARGVAHRQRVGEAVAPRLLQEGPAVARALRGDLQVVGAVGQVGDDEREARGVVAHERRGGHGGLLLALGIDEEEADRLAFLAHDLGALAGAVESAARREPRVDFAGRHVRDGDDRREALLDVADDHADVRQHRAGLRRRHGPERELVALRIELRVGAYEDAVHPNAVCGEAEFHDAARADLFLRDILEGIVDALDLGGGVFRAQPGGGHPAEVVYRPALDVGDVERVVVRTVRQLVFH